MRTISVAQESPLAGAKAARSVVLAGRCEAQRGSEAFCDESARGYVLRVRCQQALSLDQSKALEEESKRNDKGLDRLRQRAALCPECFQRAAYWREDWERRAVLACIEHRLRLVATCPICGRALSWRRLDVAHCSCGFPLALWRREMAGDAEIRVTRYVLGLQLANGEKRNPCAQLPLPVRVPFLRALGYAWMGNSITEQDRLGGLGEGGDACAFAAAGEALFRLGNPALFLVKDFAGREDRSLLQLQKLVATELYRGTHGPMGLSLQQYLQTAVAELYRTVPAKGTVLSYWIPIFLGGSATWPADVEQLPKWATARCRTVWTKNPKRVSLEALHDAWHTRHEGLSSRDCAERFNVPTSIIAGMFKRCGHRRQGGEHKYPRRAIEELLGRYKQSRRPDDYIDIATVLRYGMTIGECVSRLLDPAVIERRAVALVRRDASVELMFAKWVLPYFWSVRVVVPYGYGGIHCDLRWTSVGVAARFLHVGREEVVQWVREGRMGVILPGVPSEDMGIPRETLRRIRRSQQGWHNAESALDWRPHTVETVSTYLVRLPAPTRPSSGVQEYAGPSRASSEVSEA